MLRLRRRVCVGALALALIGLAAPAKAEPPVEVCKQYADDFARQQTSGAVVKRGVAGAALGATVGSFFGGAGTGAAIGGGLGAVGGRHRKSSAYKNLYVEAFSDCMAGRVGPL